MARTCRCGCGEPVKGLRRSKQYVDDAQRQRDRRRRAREESRERARLKVVETKPEGPDPFDENAPGWHPWPEHPWW